MSERSLRQSYHAIIRAVAAADEDALDRLIAEDMVDHNAVPGQAPGRVGIKYWMTMMHDVFADLTGVVEDTVVEGDKIAARVTWHGIHRGDFVGVPAPGHGLPCSLFRSSGSPTVWPASGGEPPTSSACCGRLVPGWLP